jgi:hypothetical protein
MDRRAQSHFQNGAKRRDMAMHGSARRARTTRGKLQPFRSPAASGYSARKSQANRPMAAGSFERLKRALLPSDTVVVTKLDRLARSSRDQHNILHDLADLECSFVSPGEAWCDTTTDVGRLMMTIMGGIAEFERGLIRKRCEEGIERAKAKGTQFGRPIALEPAPTHCRALFCRRDHGRASPGICLRRSHHLAGTAIAQRVRAHPRGQNSSGRMHPNVVPAKI